MPLPSGSALPPAGAILLRLAGRGRTAKASDFGVSASAQEPAAACFPVVWPCLRHVDPFIEVEYAQEVPQACRLRLRMRVSPARGRSRPHDRRPSCRLRRGMVLSLAASQSDSVHSALVNLRMRHGVAHSLATGRYKRERSAQLCSCCGAEQHVPCLQPSSTCRALTPGVLKASHNPEYQVLLNHRTLGNSRCIICTTAN